MPPTSHALPRRAILVGGLMLPLMPRLALAAPRALTFAVFRNNAQIGEHHVSFSGDDSALVATTEAVMTVKLGPVPVFKYRHNAVERRSDGGFVSLETRTNSNGKAEKVVAEKAGGVIRISCPSGQVTAPAVANPMTHWNPKIFAGPLFNPQNGKMLKISATKAGPGRVMIRGEAEIDDLYDDAGNWSGLKGKLDDGSTVEYKRI